MSNVTRGIDPVMLARPEVRNPTLVRPDWTRSQSRDPRLLWLDKNENTDPELLVLTARVIRDVLSGDERRAVCTYPDSAGFYAKLAHHSSVAPENLLLAAGSDGVIRSVFETFIAPGDAVIHTFPTFAMYSVYCQMYGARAAPLAYRRADDGPVLTVDEVLAAIASRPPKLVCLPNPDSPTGTVFDPSELRRIADECGRVGAVLLVDEAYYPFHPHTVGTWVQDYPHLIVARTFAKAWGLAGLRIGYAIAHPSIATLLHKVRPMYEVNTLAVTVMEQMLDFAADVGASVARLNAGRDSFLDEMEALGLRTVRARGNFLHVMFGKAEPAVSAALADLVLYRRDGGDGCLSGYSRFSATTPELFAPVIERIKNAVTGV